MESTMINRYHNHPGLAAHQCSSTTVQHIAAPLCVVWSLIRQFKNPKVYKPFVHSCTLNAGDGITPGSIRHVEIITGVPAASSVERLDLLDDELHLMVFSVLGGEHRLKNYRSTVTVHTNTGAVGECVVIESYVVDVPFGSTIRDTCVFIDTIVGINLRSLAAVSERMIGS